MLDATFTSVFGSAESLVGSVSSGAFLLCCLTSIALGVAVAGIYMFRHRYSQGFVVTLALWAPPPARWPGPTRTASSR